MTLPSWYPALNQCVNLEAVVPQLGKPKGTGEFPSGDSNFYGNSPHQPFDKWNSAAVCKGYIYWWLPGGHAARSYNGILRVGPFDTEAGPRWEVVQKRSPPYAKGTQPGDGKFSSIHTWNCFAAFWDVPGQPDGLINMGDSGFANIGGSQLKDTRRIDIDGKNQVGYPFPTSSSAAASFVYFDEQKKKIVCYYKSSSYRELDLSTNQWGSVKTHGFNLKADHIRHAVAQDQRLLCVVNSDQQAYAYNMDDLRDRRSLGNVSAQTGGDGGVAYVRGLGANGAFVFGDLLKRDLWRLEIPSNARSPSVASGPSWGSAANMGIGGTQLFGLPIQGGCFTQFCSPCPNLIVSPVSSYPGSGEPRPEHFHVFAWRVV